MQTRLHFEEEKRRIREDVLAMGVHVEEDLRKALEAFKTGNRELAQEVKKSDKEVNLFQEKIEDRCIRLIATQQPVAQDLRFLVATIKIADELERVGDHAVHLAKAALKLEGEPYIQPLSHLEAMAERGVSMIHGAIEAYMELDAEKARAVAVTDDEIDHNHKLLSNALLEYLRDNADKAKQGSKLMQTSGFLERLGDHVTNICEAIVYCVEGRHIELNE